MSIVVAVVGGGPFLWTKSHSKETQWAVVKQYCFECHNSDDLAGDQPEGFARGEQSVDSRGRRVSGWTAYLKPALKRPNLELRTKVQVRRLVFEGKRCIGVEIDGANGPEVIRANREVIVSGKGSRRPAGVSLRES